MKLITASLVASALLVGCAPKAAEKPVTEVGTGTKEEVAKMPITFSNTNILG